MLFLVDSFTSLPFSGNPAAICILPGPAPDKWMQALATEIGFSETAFLWKEGADTHRMRWFTPKMEIDLCGHATLASAHVLWESGVLRPDEPARFATKSGVLTAAREAPWITLDFPAIVPKLDDKAPPELLDALGILPSRVRGFAHSNHSAIVELVADSDVRAATPHFARLAACMVRAVSITAQAADRSDYDIVSRYFAPKIGVDEDSVTGSAHCSLAVYWNHRLGVTDLKAFQASARGGNLLVRLRGDRVLLGGEAVTISRGELIARPH